jgi:ubiquinone/menaquinone biosynthesis C-methylase UbiE
MKQGVAEALPYPDGQFDVTLMVTAICFVDEFNGSLEEIRRVLKPGGWAVFGFVDKDSPLGLVYQEHKEENIFYRDATFYSASEVISGLQAKQFEIETVRQTVFGKLDSITEVQESNKGYGQGGFVVIRAKKG